MSEPEQMRGDTIVIHAVLQASGGDDGSLDRLLRDTQLASRQEKGCVAYRMTRDIESADIFHVFEIWYDEPALQAHLAGSAFRGFLAGLGRSGRLVESRRWIGPLVPYILPASSGAAA